MDLFAPLSPAEVEALALSVKVAVAATLATLPVAFALAYLLARGRFPGRSLLDAVVHLPLVAPPVVAGLALLMLFGAQGPVGRWLAPLGVSFTFDWTGAALAAGIMALPLMVRPIRLAIESIDRAYEGAAATLGAPPIWRFLTVTLPLAWPGVLAGATLGWARAFGEFGATITFVGSIAGETRTLPLAIYGQLQAPGGEGPALRLALLSVIIALSALIAADWMFRRNEARRP